MSIWRYFDVFGWFLSDDFDLSVHACYNIDYRPSPNCGILPFYVCRFYFSVQIGHSRHAWYPVLLIAHTWFYTSQLTLQAFLIQYYNGNGENYCKMYKERARLTNGWTYRSWILLSWLNITNTNKYQTATEYLAGYNNISWRRWPIGLYCQRSYTDTWPLILLETEVGCVILYRIRLCSVIVNRLLTHSLWTEGVCSLVI